MAFIRSANLRKIFHDKSNSVSRAIDVTVLVLILLNVTCIVFEVSVQSPVAIAWFRSINIIFSAIFAIEYIFRIGTAERPLRYMLQFGKLLDFVAIYVPLICFIFGLDEEWLAALRLFRVFRVGSLYDMGSLKRVWLRVYRELFLAFLFLFIVLVVISLLMFHIEHSIQPKVFSSLGATMWWAVATLTTVGYGDVYPISVLGKTIAAIVAVLGIGVFAIPTALISAAFIEEFSVLRKERNAKRENLINEYAGERVDNQGQSK